VNASFADLENLKPILGEVDVLIHLGGNSSPRESQKQRDEIFLKELLPSLALFDEAIAQKVKRIIVASSGGAIYGNSNFGFKFDENRCPQPNSNYGYIKLFMENYLSQATIDTDTKIISLRISNAYGADQKARENFGVIPNFATSILEGRPCNVVSLETSRDFIHIDDVVEAFIKCIDYTGDNYIFNIGSGVPTRISDLIEEMGKVLNMQPSINLSLERGEQISHNCLDINRAKDELTWAPKVKLRAGLEKTLLRK
jgi:UDP-glucose 4-epimerase